VAGESAESWLVTRWRVRVGFITFYSLMAVVCLVLAWTRDQPGLLIGALFMAGFLVINVKWLRDINRDLTRTRAARDL
jgi:predicted MFS family arabinose efflux permease